MKCPYCGYQESKVVDSRHSDDGVSIRRRRECLQCQKRFTTYETVESLPIVVIKRDSSRQQFDRNKILNGMLRACEKRPVPLAELEKATDEIEQAIQNSLDREISTEKIGELVMERLKPLCVGLSPIQGHRQLHARAEQNSRRAIKRFAPLNSGAFFSGKYRRGSVPTSHSPPSAAPCGGRAPDGR